MDHWARFHTQKLALPAAHPPRTQPQPAVQFRGCPLRGAGGRLTCTEALLGPAALTSDGARSSDGSSSLPELEKEAEVLPGDKSLQTQPFSLGGKALLSEPSSLQGSTAPLVSQCVTAGILPMTLLLGLSFALSTASAS